MKVLAASCAGVWLAFAGAASAQLSGANDDPDALARDLEAADTQADGAVTDPVPLTDSGVEVVATTLHGCLLSNK